MRFAYVSPMFLMVSSHVIDEEVAVHNPQMNPVNLGYIPIGYLNGTTEQRD
jgi:hypothetical protein